MCSPYFMNNRKSIEPLPWNQITLDALATITHTAHHPKLFKGSFITDVRESEVPAQFAKVKPAFKEKPTTAFTFIDLFAGIGGFRVAGQNVMGSCVFTSEWDKYARRAYFFNFGQVPFGDITQFTKSDNSLGRIPPHDVLCGGFPCQAFSISGLQKGFKDPRGSLFFEIYKIAKFHRPKILFLENVKNFARHDNGETYKAVKGALEQTMLNETNHGTGYRVSSVVLNASDFGAPTKRERIYIVAVRNDLIKNDKQWSDWVKLLTNLGKTNGASPKYLEKIVKPINEKHPLWRKLFVNRPANLAGTKGREIKNMTKPIRLGTFGKGGQGERIYSIKGHAITFSAYGGGVASKTGAYLIDGKARKLAPVECAEAMGFDGMDVSTVDVPLLQRYKQFGNSVVVNVVEAIFAEIKRHWLTEPKRR